MSLARWDRDGHPDVIRRIVDSESEKGAAFRFLPHHLVNALTHVCGVAQFERCNVATMCAQSVAIQLRDPGQSFAIGAAAQRARYRRLSSARHSRSASLPLSVVAFPCPCLLPVPR